MAKSTKGYRPALSVTHKTTLTSDFKAKKLELNLKASLAHKLRDDLLRMKVEEIHADLQFVGGRYKTGGHRIIVKSRTHGRIPERLLHTDSGSQPVIPVNFETLDEIQQFTEMLYTFEEVDLEFGLGHLKKGLGKETTEMADEFEKYRYHISSVSHAHIKEKSKLEQYPSDAAQNSCTDAPKPVVMENAEVLTSVSTESVKPIVTENGEGTSSGSTACSAEKSPDAEAPPQNVCEPLKIGHGRCDVMSSLLLDDVSSDDGGKDTSVIGTGHDVACLGEDNWSAQTSPTYEKVSSKLYSQSPNNGVLEYKAEELQRGEKTTLAKSLTKDEHMKDRCGEAVTAEPGLKGQPVSRLASDLLWSYHQGSDTDCCLLVEGKRFQAHKCLLAARCQYFNAMFNGGWSEQKEMEVDLQGVTASAMGYMLLFIYGAMVEVPASDIGSVIQAADMFGLEELKELVAFQITQNLCHFFHKPCQGCAGSVSSILLMASQYNLRKLFKQCLGWTAKYFRRIFEVPGFGSLPAPLLEDCTKTIVEQMNVENITQVILDAHDLTRCLQQTRRAKHLQSAAASILDAAVAFSAENFPAVINSSRFLSWSKGEAWCVGVLEGAYTMAISLMQPEAACDAYISVRNLLSRTEDEAQKTDLPSPGFDEAKRLLHKLVERCEWYFHRYIHRVMQCPSWLTLPSGLQQELLHKSSFVPIQPPATSANQSLLARRSARALQKNIVNTVQLLRDIDPALFPSVPQPPRQTCAAAAQPVTQNQTEFVGKNTELRDPRTQQAAHLSASKKDRLQALKSKIRPGGMDGSRCLTRTSVRSRSAQTSQAEHRACSHTPSPDTRPRSLEKKSNSVPDAKQGTQAAATESSRNNKIDNLRSSRPSSASTKVGAALASLVRDVSASPPSSAADDGAKSRPEATTCQRKGGGLVTTDCNYQSKLKECKGKGVRFHDSFDPNVGATVGQCECVVVPVEYKLSFTFSVPSD